ncbi:hypothetical protein F3Y22_tig00000340pilonHSYRG00340 [Hibiscus syriacus]|uniref:DUF4283 domain-containing protein n=1 Tax=Hibiscus syriacus TaxID=106335 RepID=A0A6A3D634_HIBSY|nr:hypothetical protein F3Y22_tig00000340pilonHSYRG00340 [Hibiscus syriacus]
MGKLVVGQGIRWSFKSEKTTSSDKGKEEDDRNGFTKSRWGEIGKIRVYYTGQLLMYGLASGQQVRTIGIRHGAGVQSQKRQLMNHLRFTKEESEDISPPRVITEDDVVKMDKLMDSSILKDNMFLFKFKTLSDKQAILKRTQWSFEGTLLAIAHFNPTLSLEEFDFRPLAVWVRIYELPLGLMWIETMEKIGNKIGNTISTDTRSGEGRMGDYLRVRVQIDSTKPLRRCAKMGQLANGQPRKCLLKYERLPLICHRCGIIGHVLTEYPGENNGRSMTSSASSPLSERVARTPQASPVTVTILSWNCRGLGNPVTVRELRRMISEKNPVLVFVSETKLRKNKVEVVRLATKMVGCFSVEIADERVGQMMLWKEGIKVSLQSFSNLHIDMEVMWKEQRFRFTEERRSETGECIWRSSNNVSVEWIYGTFGLGLDGLPGLVFDVCWANEDQCHQIVKQVWENTDDPFSVKVGKLGDRLGTWQRERRGQAKRDEKRFRSHILWIDSGPVSDVSCVQRRKAMVELKDIVDKDEKFRLQRSRVAWLKDGDRNYTFFHTRENGRRKKNWIEGVESEGGIWCDKLEDIFGVATSYFSSLFRSSEATPDEEILQAIARCISPSDNEVVSKAIVNRLKPLMHACITENQCAFIPDYSILFVKNSIGELRKVKSILNQYEKASGQKISRLKQGLIGGRANIILEDGRWLHETRFVGQKNWEVLKSKYFPNSSFFEAKLGERHSYAWASLMKAKEALKDGFFWRVGWIVGFVCLRTSGWILGPFVGRKDIWIGLISRHHSSGSYSAKLGYNWLMIQNSPTLIVEGIWNVVAKANVLPKIRIFGWRLCHEALPAGSKMKQANLGDGFCPLCKQELELVLHAIKDCPVSKKFLSMSGLPQEINVDRAFCKDARVAAIGVVARDMHGMVIRGLAKKINHSFMAESTEAEAFSQGIRFAHENGWNNVIIEGDVISIVYRLSNRIFRKTQDI